MSEKLRVLHLEDDEDDAEIIRETLASSGIDFYLNVVKTRSDYLNTIQSGEFDLVLCDNGIPGFSSRSAFEAAYERRPTVPFVIVSGMAAGSHEGGMQGLPGSVEWVSKDRLSELLPAIRRVTNSAGQEENQCSPVSYARAMEKLLTVVQELSLARSLDAIMAIVRIAARELTGADGATFVLRDGDLCYYAEENAIAPLWKGKRFPMSICISGWVMLNRQPAIIEDVYADERIPADAYRPTFVKSLVMVPIRTSQPIGAIGNYWAQCRKPTLEEVKILQALADTTSVALENVQIYSELEQRVKDRTAELEAANKGLDGANKELEAFSYAVSHDLRAPLRSIDSFSQSLYEKNGDSLDEKGRDYLMRIRRAAGRMGQLIDDLLTLSRTGRTPVNRERIDLSGMAHEIASELRANDPGRRAEFVIAESLSAVGDPGLIRAALENLLGNGWKYTSKRESALIELGSRIEPDGQTAFFVRDNGAGFNMQYAEKLFGPFQRLHSKEEFPGTGVGLATVQRIIHKHGGRIWAEAEEDRGATFFFTLP